jgi:hypothetical protein
MLSLFVAVSLLPLGDFTAIGFSAVLIAALVARVGVKEPLGFDRLLATWRASRARSSSSDPARLASRPAPRLRSSAP